MKHIALLFSLLLSLSAMSQSVKTVKNKSRYLLEEYAVRTDNDTIRTGTYRKYFRDGNKLLEEGQYDNNRRVGVWSFYNSEGQIELLYNYSNNKILSHNRVLKDSVGIVQRADSNVAIRFNQPPIYLASSYQVLGILLRESRFPIHLQRAGHTELLYRVAATISPDGAHYRIIASHQDKEFNQNAKQALQLAFKDIKWLPGVYQAKPVTAMYMLEPIILRGFSVIK